MSKKRMIGKLHLIDLAGSERLDKSGATGQALKEVRVHKNKISVDVHPDTEELIFDIC